MTRVAAISLFVVFVVFILVGSSGALGAARSTPPDVVLIVVDALRFRRGALA